MAMGGSGHLQTKIFFVNYKNEKKAENTGNCLVMGALQSYR